MAASTSAAAYEQGKLCYQNKKFQDAIFQFSEAIRLKPENKQAEARCYNARGVVHFYLGEFKKVIKDCTKAIELDGSNANYHNCRGNAFFSLGKFQKAAEDFTEAIKLSPEASHGRYYNNRGSAYRRMKQFKEAIEDYTKAIQVDPKNGNYFNNRGNTYFDMGEYQLAINDFTNALGLEPYNPKTKLTLAQAHEALAQEKRMKNTTEYKGKYSSLKSKSGGKMKRKERDCNVYVSPNGIEVHYTHTWRNKKEIVQVAWSEEMKIELLSQDQVRLFFDKKRLSWVVITNCDGTVVEEELIGRVTSKYASYSTACLVAQHEGVCNEYLDVVRQVRKQQDHADLLKTSLSAAVKQKDEYTKKDNFKAAEQSKAQITKLEGELKEIQVNLDKKIKEAEKVRIKAETEAGPVLEMVLIMQNRVKELYHARVKGGKEQNKDDAELERQMLKMENLVQRARELNSIVAKPVKEINTALGRAQKDAEDEEEEEMEAALKKEKEKPTSAPAAAPAAAPAPAPAKVPASPAASSTTKGDESDEEDWDDVDDSALQGAFAPNTDEVIMTVEERGGMVLITPSKSASGDNLMALRKGSLVAMTAGSQGTQVKLDEVKKETEQLQKQLKEREKALTDFQQSQQKSLAQLRAEADEAKAQLLEKDIVLSQLQNANRELSDETRLQEQLKAMVAQEVAKMESQQKEMAQKLKLTADEKETKERAFAQQQMLVAELKEQMDKSRRELELKAAEVEDRQRKYEEFEKRSAELEQQIAKFKQETETEKKRNEQLKTEYESKIQNVVAGQEQLQKKVGESEAEKAALKEQMELQNMTLSQLRKHMAEVQKQLEAQSAERKKDLEKMEEMKEIARAEEMKRRELHNLIQEIKGNIRVYVRLRPNTDKAPKSKTYETVLGSDDRGMTVTGPPEASATGKAAPVSKKWEFEFDRIFWPDNTQEDIFKEISQLVQSALDGYKVSIFAYGQTGSGKTFTMEGPSSDAKLKGVIPRSVEQIFRYREECMKKGWTYKIEASFLEIYNTQIRDLLSAEDIDVDENKHEIKLVKVGEKTQTVVANLTTVPVESPESLAPMLKKANGNRATAATKMNDRSSRSHSVFTLRIVGTHLSSGQETLGVLNLVDLAGSERIEKSGAGNDPKRLEEAKNINYSLTCLGDVIAALATNAKHIPFRNTKLTYLLQDSFGGGSKTLMFINVAPEESSLPESLNSLRFGAKVHECHIGAGKKQVKALPAAPSGKK